MKPYLKKYQVVLKTVGPVFVGSGKEIGKKEYVFLGKDKVGIPDIQKLFYELKRRGKEREFETYLLHNNRDDLTSWLKKQNIYMKEIVPFINYSLDCGDAIIETGKRLQIMECVKDAYGKPYVPGSTLKGMFRTILLSADIVNNRNKFASQREELISQVFSRNRYRVNRNTFLKNDVSKIEAISFRTLNKNKKKLTDAVNDYMQGFIVSDSEPLSEEDLVLCQKVEVHPDGTERRLPLLRECIKPDTNIKFTITIDTSVCSVNEKELMSAVKIFMQVYHSYFAKSFAGVDYLRANQVFLGGGCGFVSKTVVYSLFGKQKGLEMTKNIFDKTGVPKMHKHDKDSAYGVSPHILKCTRYRGTLLHMGLCSLKIQKE